MQSFTKIEISWIITELEKAAKSYEKQARETPDKQFAKMYQLRFEQYTDISSRLRAALKKGNKRIQIK